MFNSVYFLIIMIFSCLICLFFVIFNLYYNERYLSCICASNICVVLSILLLVLYKAANEHWILKGITSVVFCCGILLSTSAILVLMKVKLKPSYFLVILGFLIVDFFCYPFCIGISVFLHKIILVLVSLIVAIMFLQSRSKSLLAKLLLCNNIILAIIQWIFTVIFYSKGPTYFFWDNVAYIIHNFITSTIFVCITIQESKAYYAQRVDELKGEIVLGQKQLQESYEKNELRSSIFADLSHELKTPINVIYSNIQLFEKCMSEDSTGIAESDKYLKSMQKNCYRLIKLVNNIIDMNKIESGYMKLEVKNYNIIPFIEDMVMSINAFAMQKQINVIFDTEIEELIIACDMDKVEKIVFNLLSNAIKYTPEGGEVLVYISYDTNDIYITVQDTGEGIPEELHEAIFGRFIQNKGELHQKYNSSGIGLALVKSLAELQQGRIWIDKEYKKGCKMIFSLPRIVLDHMEPILYNNMGYSECNIEFI